MDSTISTSKMSEQGKIISEKVTELKTRIDSIVEAAKNAQSLRSKALEYNNKELTGEKTEVICGKDDDRKRITTYVAHVDASTGEGESALQSITRAGLVSDKILPNIERILDLTDNDLPEVIDCINKGIDEIETSLAAHESPEGLGNEEPEFEDTSGGGPSGGGSSGGGKSSHGSINTNPQFKEASNDKTDTYKEDKKQTNKTEDKVEAQIISKLDNKVDDTFKKTDKNEETNFNNVINKDKDKTTTQNDSITTIKPTTETNPDKPIATASVGLSHGTPSSTDKIIKHDNIEILGDDEPKSSNDNTNLGDSIINGINKVLPGIKSGKKVQSGSAIIPGAAGLTAAAAAGVGSKSLLDRADNFVSLEDVSSKSDDDDDDKKDKTEEEAKHKGAKGDNKKEDKSWLYGMGVGIATLGGATAKHEHDKKKEEETIEYEIADDREPELELLEDD